MSFTLSLQIVAQEVTGAGRYRGVNHSGSEYSCVKGGGVFEGPVDQNAVNVMKSWNINMVRIPLNSDCWLGINGRAGIAANYKRQITDYVDLLLRNGISVVLALMWSNGPNTSGLPNSGFCREDAANCLKPMPDKKWSEEFWAQVGTWFKYNNEIFFDLFNEPFPDRVGAKSFKEVWTCWRDGGNACYWVTYECVGMQRLVEVVRDTGARNPIMVAGVNFANDVTGWIQYVPKDRGNNLYLSFHVYRNNYFNRIAQFSNYIKLILKTHKIIVGEFGESDCGHNWVDEKMQWFDVLGVSYLAWTWNPWGCTNGNNGLISDWSGTPTVYGQGIKDHYRKL